MVCRGARPLSIQAGEVLTLQTAREGINLLFACSSSMSWSMYCLVPPRWSNDIRLDTTSTHNVHPMHLGQIERVSPIIYGPQNNIWMESTNWFDEKLGEQYGANTVILSHQRTVLLITAVISIQASQCNLGDQSTFRILFPARYAGSEYADKLMVSLQEVCRQRPRAQIAAFPGTITIDFAKPDESCSGCKGVI